MKTEYPPFIDCDETRLLKKILEEQFAAKAKITMEIIQQSLLESGACPDSLTGQPNRFGDNGSMTYPHAEVRRSSRKRHVRRS